MFMLNICILLFSSRRSVQAATGVSQGLEDILEIPARAAWAWQQPLYRWQTFSPDGDALAPGHGFPIFRSLC
jgi:hypothetical protein